MSSNGIELPKTQVRPLHNSHLAFHGRVGLVHNLTLANREKTIGTRNFFPEISIASDLFL